MPLCAFRLIRCRAVRHAAVDAAADYAADTLRAAMLSAIAMPLI